MLRVPTSLLRVALVADALVSGAMGVLTALAADPLGGLLGLPRAAALERPGRRAFALILGWLGLRPEQPIVAVQAIILINLAWVAGSVLALALLPAPSALGYTFVALQALAVLALAAAQWIGRRRVSRASVA